MAQKKNSKRPTTRKQTKKLLLSIRGMKLSNLTIVLGVTIVVLVGVLIVNLSHAGGSQFTADQFQGVPQKDIVRKTNGTVYWHALASTGCDTVRTDNNVCDPYPPIPQTAHVESTWLPNVAVPTETFCAHVYVASATAKFSFSANNLERTTRPVYPPIAPASTSYPKGTHYICQTTNSLLASENKMGATRMLSFRITAGQANVFSFFVLPVRSFRGTLKDTSKTCQNTASTPENEPWCGLQLATPSTLYNLQGAATQAYQASANQYVGKSFDIQGMLVPAVDELGLHHAAYISVVSMVPNDPKSSFIGTISADNCNIPNRTPDVGCSIVVDGKTIDVLFGNAYLPAGHGRFIQPTNSNTASLVGKQVEVYAQKISDTHYTLEGSTNYYAKVLN